MDKKSKRSSAKKTDLLLVPLKDKSAKELVAEVLTTPQSIQDSFALGTALNIAFYAHAKQVRHTPIVTSSGKIRHKSTAYIYHPLRNTVRLMRWGVTDINVLLASVLHDTVEDAPKRLCEWGVSARDLSFLTDEISEEDYRRKALLRIGNLFGPEVRRIVNEVTNPLPTEGQTKAERNQDYIHHVSVAVRDPKVFLVKFADICDNALSLHFTPPSPKRDYLASRYLPLAPILETAFCGLRQTFMERNLVSNEGVHYMERRVNNMEKYLTTLNENH